MTILQDEEQGLRIIASGTDAVADVVLVHGLKGHPRRTWLYGADVDAKKNAKPGIFESLKQKFSSPDEERQNKQPSFFWPREALAEDHSALRIAVYGYDTQVSNFFRGPSSQTSLVGHGRSLLNALESFRRGVPTERPIIFIVHSLGGLVLKSALIRAYKAESYEREWRAIYEATRAILFLGTPHSGSETADWGLIARNVASAVGFDASSNVVRDLQVDASILDSLREGFSKILRQESFWVFTFIEEKGFKGTRFLALNDKIVRDASATLGYAREQIYYINANHVEMCRFRGKADIDNGYRQVKDAIEKSLEGRPAPVPRSGTTHQSHRICKYRQILDILGDDGSYSLRYEQVEVPFGDSFSWLFTNDELGFVRWLKEGGGLYWIRGLPATGKSTLMKMAYNHEITKETMQNSLQNHVQAEFFFHDRGSASQKSFTGLLRGILHQILSTEPELLDCVEQCFDPYLTANLTVESARTASPLTHSVISTAFQNLIQQRSTSIDVYLFLDALDEYSGAKTEIAKFVKNIASTSSSTNPCTKFHVCFSSRLNNDLLDCFQPLQLPGFDIKDHTKQDIATVAHAMMHCNQRVSSILDSGTCKAKNQVIKLHDAVCDRAEGVFLWVRLVLQDILQEYTDGRSLDELHDLLATLPSDLEQYYTERVIDRILPQHRDDALIMIDIVRCSLRPLQMLEFYSIFRNARKTDLQSWTEPAESDSELSHNVDRLLRSRCGGLIEKIQPATGGSEQNYKSEPQIQFVHLTVKTWASRVETRKRISPSLAHRSTGYEYYSRYFVSWLNCWLEQDKSTMQGRWNFVRFHLENEFLEHCAIAEHQTAIAQTEILTQLKNQAVLWLYDSITWKSVKMRLPITNLLTFAVAAELEIFLNEYVAMFKPSARILEYALRIAVRLPETFNVPSGNVNRRARIVQLLLDLGANSNYEKHGLTTFESLWIFKKPTDTSNIDLTRVLEPNVRIVNKFLEHGQNPDTFLTYRERAPTRGTIIRNVSLLHMACMMVDTDVVRALVHHGASTNVLDSQRQTPLDRAARHFGRRIQDYLDRDNNQSTRESNRTFDRRGVAIDLQARLTCVSLLLDAGAKQGYDPDMSEPAKQKYQGLEPVAITQAHIDALLDRGFDVDDRIMELPKQGQSLVGTLGETLSTTTKWLLGG